MGPDVAGARPQAKFSCGSVSKLSCMQFGNYGLLHMPSARRRSVLGSTLPGRRVQSVPSASRGFGRVPWATAFQLSGGSQSGARMTGARTWFPFDWNSTASSFEVCQYRSPQSVYSHRWKRIGGGLSALAFGETTVTPAVAWLMLLGSVGGGVWCWTRPGRKTEACVVLTIALIVPGFVGAGWVFRPSPGLGIHGFPLAMVMGSIWGIVWCWKRPEKKTEACVVLTIALLLVGFTGVSMLILFGWGTYR